MARAQRFRGSDSATILKLSAKCIINRGRCWRCLQMVLAVGGNRMLRSLHPPMLNSGNVLLVEPLFATFIEVEAAVRTLCAVTPIGKSASCPRKRCSDFLLTASCRDIRNRNREGTLSSQDAGDPPGKWSIVFLFPGMFCKGRVPDRPVVQ